MRVRIAHVELHRLPKRLRRQREVIFLQRQLAAGQKHIDIRRLPLLDDVIDIVQHLLRIDSLAQVKPAHHYLVHRVAIPPRCLLDHLRDFDIQLAGPLRLPIELAHLPPQPAKLQAIRKPLQRLVQRFQRLGIPAQLHLRPNFQQPIILAEIILRDRLLGRLHALGIFAAAKKLRRRRQIGGAGTAAPARIAATN